jgi:hypothetical protein
MRLSDFRQRNHRGANLIFLKFAKVGEWPCHPAAFASFGRDANLSAEQGSAERRGI